MDYGRYVFSCLIEDDAVLPPYKGSTLRGIFGHALKKVVCALKKQNCAECLLADRCIYPTVFEIPSKVNETSGRKRIVSRPILMLLNRRMIPKRAIYREILLISH